MQSCGLARRRSSNSALAGGPQPARCTETGSARSGYRLPHGKLGRSSGRIVTVRHPIRLGVVVAVAGVTSMVASAAGAVLYGGGSARTGREQLVSLAFDPNSGRLAVGALLVDHRGCDAGKIAAASGVRVGADGHFHTHLHSSGFAARIIRSSFDGRLSSTGPAAGTARLMWRAGGRKCDTGVVHWRAWSVNVAGAGGHRRGALYGGYTSQVSTSLHVHLPFVARLASDGRSVAEIAAYINVRCASPSDSSAAAGDFAYQNIAIRDKSFGLDQRFTDSSVPGVTIDYREKFRGALGSKGASGSWSLQATVTDADGTVDRCLPSRVSWVAGPA